MKQEDVSLVTLTCLSHFTYTVNVTGETTVLNKNLAQHKARILLILSWKSWENRVFPTIKQEFPQQKASKILF